ncbi:MAG: BamA/TamA family outer membrane protein [Flavobacteriales bacterium]|nr:BamA/TamA family outer membrane protein [Flavobacteriales bacterium]MBK7246924.1 BamA/TamA family outer membrane protein [Flavobacteriales bacterium]MBK9061517.1 BamA/TamA family outer membrane protein [Flavobacteriales bacterium]QQS72590.1 MAG: BamA/TamA family outer membrane protein [Flavobacteriales bacterium]HQV40341.1 BamA/TamA family outer membrane protein [Flavobacteriales bacterium]
MRYSKFHIPLLVAVTALLAACNPTKRVPKGEHLLVRNIVKSDAKDLTTDELKGILKQKPNNKVLGQRLYLHFYNWSSPEKTASRKAEVDSICAVKNVRRAEKAVAKNAKRIARGKEPKQVKDKECRRTLRVWLREDVGEAPVILDSSLVDRSVDQLKLYLGKEGFFNATVSDTIFFERSRLFSNKRGSAFRQPKAEVEYRITAGRPYTICSAEWSVDDPAIDSLVRASRASTLLVPGIRFDADVLDKERNRITEMLRKQGYLYFTRDLLQYVADTSAGDQEVDLQLRFERPLARGRRGLAGTPEGTVYFLEDITVDMTQRPGFGKKPLPSDTVEYKNYTFLFTGKRPAYRPKALSSSLLLKGGSKFSETTNDRTYRRLLNLNVFNRVDITFDTTQTRSHNQADCLIDVIPSKRQSLSLEGFGTNRGGFLGTSVSLNYRHKNLFRSMGSIQARMALGLEAQQSLDGRGSAGDASSDVGHDVLFNTVEIGPEVTIRFPRFIIPFWNTDDRWPNTWGRRTAVNLLYNYQRRPDYTRTLAKMSYGYEWNKSRTLSMALYPAEVNIIRIPLISTGFQDFIRTSNDAVLRDSYTDHVIAGARATLTLNTQEGDHKRNVFLWRPTLQTAGNLLRLTNEAFRTDQQTDTAGNSFYTLAGVRFAQFVKVENDMRYYHTIHSKSSLAFRVDAGVGVPFGNLGVLPFESSFFSGGANGIRAWRARSLGPGSYSAPLDAFDRVGEIRIEGNAEYRFKLIGYLEGAFFVDIGNIWDLQENPAKPGSGFQIGKAAGELAFGTGVGARLNFDFFLVRFDLGLQTKDPGLPMGQRWLFQPKSPELTTTLGNKLNFNLGIGYPF